MSERPRLQKHHSSSSVAQASQHSPAQRPAHAVGGQRARLGPRIPSHARNVNKLPHQRAVQLPRNTSKTQLRKNQSETALHRRNRSANLEVSSGREAYEIPEETAGALEEVKGRRLSEGSSPEKRRDDGGGDEDDDSGKGPGPAEGQAGEETAPHATSTAPLPSSQPPKPPTFALTTPKSTSTTQITSTSSSNASISTTNKDQPSQSDEMPVRFAPDTKPGSPSPPISRPRPQTASPSPPCSNHPYPPSMWNDSTMYKVIPHLTAPPSESDYTAIYARRLESNIDRRLANLAPGNDPILVSMRRLGVDPTKGLREEKAAKEKEKEAVAAAAAGGKKGRVANLKEQEGGKSFFSLARLFGGGGKKAAGGEQRKNEPSEAELHEECALKGIREVMERDDEFGARVREVVRAKIGELRGMRQERAEAEEALKVAEEEVKKKQKAKGKK